MQLLLETDFEIFILSWQKKLIWHLRHVILLAETPTEQTTVSQQLCCYFMFSLWTCAQLWHQRTLVEVEHQPIPARSHEWHIRTMNFNISAETKNEIVIQLFEVPFYNAYRHTVAIDISVHIFPYSVKGLRHTSIYSITDGLGKVSQMLCFVHVLPPVSREHRVQPQVYRLHTRTRRTRCSQVSGPWCDSEWFSVAS